MFLPPTLSVAVANQELADSQRKLRVPAGRFLLHPDRAYGRQKQKGNLATDLAGPPTLSAEAAQQLMGGAVDANALQPSSAPHFTEIERRPCFLPIT